MKSLKRVFCAVSVLFCLLLSGCAHKEAVKGDQPADLIQPDAEKTTAVAMDETSVRVNEARDLILDYFAPVEGVVEKVDGKSVLVAISSFDGVKSGLRLSVFREGEPFYHPVTNELIGKSEDLVGRVEIQAKGSSEAVYNASLINGDIRAGDKARISSSKVKLAFFQDKRANWSLSESFYGALKKSERFELAEAYAPDYEPETLARLARKLGAESYLVFSTPVNNKKRVLNAKLHWADDAYLFAEIEKEIQDVSFISSSEEFISLSYEGLKPWRMFSLSEGKLLSMGDVDGNGDKELVVSDGNDIRIYSVNDGIREQWNIELEDRGLHLSVDIVDLNGNGISEIYVTSLVNAGNIIADDHEVHAVDTVINSFVVEYIPDEGYKTLVRNMPFFFRVSGDTLFMQPFNDINIFGSTLYSGRWEGDKVITDQLVPLPDFANIYGFNYIDWDDDGQGELVTFDDDGYLYLFDVNGKLKWRSERSFGPYIYTFQSKSSSVVSPSIKWSVRGRLNVVETERGKEVVLISRKPLLKNVPGIGFNEANILSLRWNGESMEESVVLSELSGAVTDYWIEGNEMFLIAKSDIISVLKSLAGGDFASQSTLYLYKFDR